MDAKPRTPEETYGPALAKALQALPRLDPHRTAARAAVVYDGSAFQVPFFGTPYLVQWPEGAIRQANARPETDVTTRLLLLHYLLTADGAPQADKWIAFRNLPGGLGYDAAFQGRANLRLARAFGSNRAAFERSAQALGSERLTFGDASFSFRALPCIWLAVVLHLADDEFPEAVNLLFDASASHYLPTEDLAVLGGVLAGRLLKAAKA